MALFDAARGIRENDKLSMAAMNSRSAQNEPAAKGSPRDGSGFHLADAIALGCILVLAASFRVALAWVYRNVSIPDVGIVALMAKHVAEGSDWPVFFYGQAYMGSAEPLLSALLCKVFGVSGFSVNLGTVLAGLLLLPVLYGWGRQVAGRRAAIAAASFAIVLSHDFSFYMVLPRGGYALVLACIGVVLWLTAHLVSREACGKPGAGVTYAALGLVAGLGWWTSQMMAPALLAAAVAFLFVIPRRGVLIKAAVGGAAFFLGGAPWWIWNLRFHWPTFAFVESLGMVSAWRGLWLMGSGLMPRLMGVGCAASDSWWAMAASPVATAIVEHTAQLLAAAAYLLLILLALRAGCAKHPAGARKYDMRRVSILLACLYLGVFAMLACRSHFLLMRSSRYMLPLIPAVALLLGVGVDALWRINRTVAIGVAALVFLFQTRPLPGMLRGGAGLDALRHLAGEIARELPAAQTPRVYGNYALHWLNFATGEAVMVCSLPHDRVHGYKQALEMCDHPGFLNNFGGAADFVTNSGGACATVGIDGIQLTHAICPPALPVVCIPPAAWSCVSVDGTNALDPRVLSDRNLSTWVSAAIPDDAPHEVRIALHATQHVTRVRWFAPDISDYPDQWQVEGRETPDGPWVALGGPGHRDQFVWSGPRLYWTRAQYHARVDFAARALCELRLVVRGGERNHGRFAAAELDLFAPAPPPEVAETNGVAALMAALREARVSRLYCGRWEANQVARHSAEGIWTPRESSIWGRETQEGEREPADGWLPLDLTTGTAVLVRSEEAATARELLSSRFVATLEIELGPWVLLRVDPSKPIPMPTSDLVWTGVGLLYRQWSLDAFAKANWDAIPRGVMLQMARYAMEEWPQHPGWMQLVADIGAAENDPEAASWQTRARAMRSPEIPLDIRFGRQLVLVGVSGLAGVFAPGGTIPYRVFWRNIGAGSRPTFFAHVRDAAGVVFQDDVLVAEGQTTEACAMIEQDGLTVSQERVLRIPAHVRPGTYHVLMGVWQPATSQRYRPHTKLKKGGTDTVEIPGGIVIATGATNAP